MTSATERLRAPLDERGVEWRNVRNDGEESDYFTEWQFDGIEGHAIATEWAVGHPLTVCVAHPMTPEQAVAATLGPGTCHIDLVGYNERENRFQCRSCDWSMSVRRGTWPCFNYCPNCGRRVDA